MANPKSRVAQLASIIDRKVTTFLFQLLGLIGGRSRTRTCDPLIKSQLLYQLSYAPDHQKQTGP